MSQEVWVQYYFNIPLELKILLRGKRGVLWISSDRDNQRIFLCSKFSISGFFGIGKFWKVFFWVA